MSLALDAKTSSFPQEIIGGMIPTQGKRYMSQKFDSILHKSKTILSRAQLRYKTDSDKAVRSTGTFKADQMIYLDKAPSDIPLDEIDLASRKLLKNSIGAFKVLRASSHTFHIERDILEDMVAIDRVAKGPSDTTSRKNASDSVVPTTFTTLFHLSMVRRTLQLRRLYQNKHLQLGSRTYQPMINHTSKSQSILP